MRPDIIEELGLSPQWQLKQLRQQEERREHSPEAAETAASDTAAPVAAPAEAAPVETAATQMPDIASAPVQSPAPPAPPAASERPMAIVSKMNWQQLRDAVNDCLACPLCERRTNPAFGTGDQQATVMFIGEGPGEEEDQQGEPFVGRAGKLLDLMLHAIELDRSNVYIANVVKCRPPGNRNPEVSEAQQCLPYLRRQIALVKPHLLVALGKVASTHLLGSETSIAQLRQKMHEFEHIPLVVTYHPAYLLRSPQEKRKSWEDLKFIRHFLSA